MSKRQMNSFTIFHSLPVDEAATRAAVIGFLEEVRQYRQIGYIRELASVTHSYSQRYHGATHAVHKPTEQVALRNIDREAELRRKSELLDQAMGGLTVMQREVIERSYLAGEREYDFISCGEMGISDRTYRRIKASALKLLAIAMKLEVFVEPEERRATLSVHGVG
ncbi:ArpU family phage packaging/lysis transcriptional regulator [Paenibacillus woosongensis]|uniref:ArpU family phage packaging/lysis transcriptional regulator n=1 Tax=Paenibacillus woosongensis TaxID=307580 RepID=A0AA95I1J0_9BACL|nr:ArpU family phage packaging/lysis transcriptional regulator [Paenibacillus woosongensis]WHX47886.1 ArpU family phage packaging/lysis transcriptional regulator [Paenibacillus woosongensis]